jgi:hypothetical protein
VRRRRDGGAAQVGAGEVDAAVMCGVLEVEQAVEASAASAARRVLPGGSGRWPAYGPARAGAADGGAARGGDASEHGE